MRLPFSAAIALGAASLLAACSMNPSPQLNYSTAAADTDEFEKGARQPPNARTLFSLSRLLVAQGRDEEAQAVLQRVVAEHPTFIVAYTELAELHMRNQRLGEAIRVLQSGLNRAPKNPVLLNNLGLCWLLREEYDGAAFHFTQAVAVDPTNARYRANLATALGKQGRYDESLAMFLQVLNRKDAHYNVGVLAEARGDRDRATREFATARTGQRDMRP